MPVKNLLFVLALILCPIALSAGCGDGGNTVIEGEPENVLSEEEYNDQSYTDTDDEDQN